METIVKWYVDVVVKRLAVLNKRRPVGIDWSWIGYYSVHGDVSNHTKWSNILKEYEFFEYVWPFYWVGTMNEHRRYSNTSKINIQNTDLA